jgi:ABC-2 type transport system ATP-binding protein
MPAATRALSLEADDLAVAIEGVVRCFGATRALDGLSLRVRAGEMYGLVGPDGAGKTTTMRILAGMIDADAGCVEVLGLEPLRGGRAFREAIGYMPQQYSLYGDLSVEENLRFFSHMFCLPRAAYRERRERLLRITRLARFVDRRADALSGGMYKKLALACALLPRPRLLLMDEPTNGVDPVSRRELWAMLFELAGEGMAIVVSTPYMDEAARCHRVGLIHQGRLLLEGTPAELLAGFVGDVFYVMGGDRDRSDRLLSGHPAVQAVSAAGAQLRVVLRPDAAAEVGLALADCGAELRRVAPTFEDLFLSATKGAGA